MPGLLSIIGAPLKVLGDAVSEVTNSIAGNATERQAAAAALQQAQLALQAKLIDADSQLAQEQAEVIENEEKEGWLPANWRPILMLSFGLIIIYNYFVGPMFHLPTVQNLPPQLWTLMTGGIGGYVGARTVEKLADSDGVANIVSMVTGNKQQSATPAAPVTPAAKVVTAVEDGAEALLGQRVR